MTAEPDEEYIWTDDAGADWFKFLCDYRDFDGNLMAFEFWALSQKDAQERIMAIADTGRVRGQLLQVVEDDDATAYVFHAGETLH